MAKPCTHAPRIKLPNLVVPKEVVFEQKSQQSFQLLGGHPESKIGSHLIIHAQRIPRSLNPPNNGHREENSWSFYTSRNQAKRYFVYHSDQLQLFYLIKRPF
jgi:hypothetical protein